MMSGKYDLVIQYSIVTTTPKDRGPCLELCAAVGSGCAGRFSFCFTCTRTHARASGVLVMMHGNL